MSHAFLPVSFAPSLPVVRHQKDAPHRDLKVVLHQKDAPLCDTRFAIRNMSFDLLCVTKKHAPLSRYYHCGYRPFVYSLQCTSIAQFVDTDLIVVLHQKDAPLLDGQLITDYYRTTALSHYRTIAPSPHRTIAERIAPSVFCVLQSHPLFCHFERSEKSHFQ